MDFKDGTYYDLTGEKIKDINIIRVGYNLGNITNPTQVNQISGGFINYTYCYYNEAMKNDSVFGDPISIDRFSAPSTDVNSVVYKFNLQTPNIWTIDSNINNGRVILYWQPMF